MIQAEKSSFVKNHRIILYIVFFLKHQKNSKIDVQFKNDGDYANTE